MENHYARFKDITDSLYEEHKKEYITTLTKAAKDYKLNARNKFHNRIQEKINALRKDVDSLQWFMSEVEEAKKDDDSLFIDEIFNQKYDLLAQEEKKRLWDYYTLFYGLIKFGDYWWGEGRISFEAYEKQLLETMELTKDKLMDALIDRGDDNYYDLIELLPDCDFSNNEKVKSILSHLNNNGNIAVFGDINSIGSTVVINPGKSQTITAYTFPFQVAFRKQLKPLKNSMTGEQLMDEVFEHLKKHYKDVKVIDILNTINYPDKDVEFIKALCDGITRTDLALSMEYEREYYLRLVPTGREQLKYLKFSEFVKKQRGESLTSVTFNVGNNSNVQYQHNANNSFQSIESNQATIAPYCRFLNEIKSQQSELNVHLPKQDADSLNTSVGFLELNISESNPDVSLLKKVSAKVYDIISKIGTEVAAKAIEAYLKIPQ